MPKHWVIDAEHKVFPGNFNLFPICNSMIHILKHLHNEARLKCNSITVELFCMSAVEQYIF